MQKTENAIRALVNPVMPKELKTNFINSNSNPAHPNIKKYRNGSILLAITVRITPNMIRPILSGNILSLSFY